MTSPARPSATLSLLLGDGRLPTGGHTQSGGLEPALLAGLPERSIPALIATRLRTSATVDAACAVVAMRLLDTGSDAAEPVDLTPVILAWAARTPSEVVRASAIEVGRGYARLGRRLGAPTPAVHEPRPVAFARVAHRLGLSPAEAARVICHDEVQAICSAALKLAPSDPVDVVDWAVQAAALVEDVVATVTGPGDMDDLDDLPAPSAPALELWQHAHAHAPRRLFRA